MKDKLLELSLRSGHRDRLRQKFLDGELAKSGLSLLAEGAVANVTASKKTDDGTIAMTAVLFDSAKNAKAFYNASKDDEKKTSLILSGKWVMDGDEKAVKDFK